MIDLLPVQATLGQQFLTETAVASCFFAMSKTQQVRVQPTFPEDFTFAPKSITPDVSLQIVQAMQQQMHMYWALPENVRAKVRFYLSQFITITITDLDQLDEKSTQLFFDNLHQIAVALCGNAPVRTFESKAQAAMRDRITELCPSIIQERAELDPHREC